jgi:hypothetical protein
MPAVPCVRAVPPARPHCDIGGLIDDVNQRANGVESASKCVGLPAQRERCRNARASPCDPAADPSIRAREPNGSISSPFRTPRRVS